MSKNSVSGKQASKKEYESQTLSVEKSKGVRQEGRGDCNEKPMNCKEGPAQLKNKINK